MTATVDSCLNKVETSGAAPIKSPLDSTTLCRASPRNVPTRPASEAALPTGTFNI